MFVEEQSLPNYIAVYLQGVQQLWLSCVAHVRTTFRCVLHSDLLLMPTELTHIKLSSLVLQVACYTGRDFKVPWWPSVLRFVVVFSTFSNPPTKPQTLHFTLFLTHLSLIALLDLNDCLSEISKNSFVQNCLASPCQPVHPYHILCNPNISDGELALPDSNLIRYFPFK